MNHALLLYCACASDKKGNLNAYILRQLTISKAYNIDCKHITNVLQMAFVPYSDSSTIYNAHSDEQAP